MDTQRSDGDESDVMMEQVKGNKALIGANKLEIEKNRENVAMNREKILANAKLIDYLQQKVHEHDHREERLNSNLHDFKLNQE